MLPIEPDQEYDFLYKLVIIGDTCVGKTSILSKFFRNEFDINSNSTIGVEFSKKLIKVENSTINLQVWDTAGQERFRAITTAYYRGSKGILLVYDITNINTFDNLNRWLDESYNIVGHIPIMLIGNKCDLKHKRQVSTEMGKEFAEKYGCMFLETSALDSTNIIKAFMDLVNYIYQESITKPKNILDETIINADKIIIPDTVEKKQSKCC